MVEAIHCEDLSPGRFRSLLVSLGTLLNSIGRDALTQLLEERDEARASAAHSARLVFVRATKNPCALDRFRKKLLAVPALVVVSARRATIALNAGLADLWARFLRTLAVPNAA